MRIQSEHPTKNGGWLHKIGEPVPYRFILKEAKPEPAIDVASLWLRWFEATDYALLKTLAIQLSVNADALCALGCARTGQAWAFPMKDSTGEIIGIRLRNDEGQKWAVKGSRQGLFIPEVDTQKTLFITEGPTDTAAALAIGLYAIGRPSCRGCEETAVRFIRQQKISRVVIVADNDGPGLDGALKLKSKMPGYSCLWTPPCKDLREFVRLGGNAQLIESSLKDLVWERAA